MQIKVVNVAKVLYLNSRVPGYVQAPEPPRHHADHPGHDPPGEHAGASRGVLTLGVKAGHHPRAVTHHVTVAQAENNYSAIEGELLGVTWALERTKFWSLENDQLTI